MRLTEKYRPKTWDELVAPEDVKSSLKRLAQALKENWSTPPSLLFVGPPGTGKTTSAQLFAKEVFGDEWKESFVELNASDERGIDVIRGKVKNFSQLKGRRIIFLDECDAMTTDAQQALRRIMETTKSAMFILAANQENKLIDAIQSRCVKFRFQKFRKDELATVLDRVITAEKVELVKNSEEDEKMMGILISRFLDECDGDMRYMLNQLEKLVDGDRKVDAQKLVLLLKPVEVSKSLELALKGNLDDAKNLIEDDIRSSGWERVVLSLWDAVGGIKDEEYRSRLMIKLAETEFRCRMGSNPTIQVVGFLAYAWLLPHAKPVV